MRRRHFILTAAAACLAGPALAMGQDAKVGIALLRHGKGFDQRPSAVEQLMWEVSKRTSIDTLDAPVLRVPDDADFFRYPLLFWVGTGPCEPMPDAMITRLQRYMRAGGLLVIDDASPMGDDRFDVCARRAIKRLWPDRPLAPLPEDHTLFRSFFLLPRPYGRIDRSADLEGITFDDHCPLIYSRNDLLGAFGRGNLGNWLLPVEPGGRTQREMAFRLGVNLLMYATCLNYKRDQVHTTAILRRRRWRANSQKRGR